MSKSAQLQVSVVIPCRDRGAQLEVCLAAVRELNPPACEIVVVDSGSRCGEEIRAVAVRSGARYLRLDRPGVSLAKNVGARSAHGEIVAFLDDDAIPAADWLAHLAEPFAEAQVACVTSRTASDPAAREDGTYRLLGFVRREDSPRRIAPGDSDWFRAACFGGIGISPGLAIRRVMWERWPGFHERLGPGTPIHGNEEGHAFLDLVRLGYSIQYAPEALVYHPVPAPEWAALKRRYCDNLSAATGFILMLMLEEHGCRWMTAGYVMSKLRRISPLWRREKISQSQSVIPGWQVFLARARGVVCYLRSLAVTDTRAASLEAAKKAASSADAGQQLTTSR